MAAAPGPTRAGIRITGQLIDSNQREYVGVMCIGIGYVSDFYHADGKVFGAVYTDSNFLTSGGTVVKVEAPVYLTLEDRSGEGMEIDSVALQQNMQRQMLGVAEKAIADSWRPGGTSHRNTSGRG
ncbi:hypothetical protein RD00_13895 [Pseudomonas amygdali pv. tabaci]|nr:hypothetical protein RD00_13895 [Pseudomonas amygdali pv. tabaci]